MDVILFAIQEPKSSLSLKCTTDTCFISVNVRSSEIYQDNFDQKYPSYQMQLLSHFCKTRDFFPSKLTRKTT